MRFLNKLLCAVLAAALCFCAVGCDGTVSTAGSTNGLNLHMLDVGQGDSLLLECDGSYMLVDAGEVDKGNRVVEYLKGQNVRRLSYAVITHPHSDHFGGMKKVLQSIPTDSIVMTEAYNTTRAWESLIDYIDKENFNVVFPKTNDVFNVGGCKVNIYSPNIDNDNKNNCSLVLRAVYDNMAVLLTGDAEKSEEKEILESGFNVQADVLKLGHHGSSTSTSSEFLKKVSPSLALISCGKNNDYGHPHNEILSKLKNSDIPVMRTDLDKAVTVSLCNNKITVLASKREQVIPKRGGADTSLSSEVSSADSSQHRYIGNKSSRVFHLGSCKSVNKMSDKNKVYFDSRKQAAESGYSPCGYCKP